MGLLQFFQWGILLQVLAVLHFIRRRPDTFWLWIIIFFGPPGAFIYILMEVVPDLGLIRHSFEGFGRRKRITYLEALVQQNPAAGNYEELGDLYLDEGKYAKARECYDKAITPRTTHADPFYRRGVAAIQMGDFSAAAEDLEHVTSQDPKYRLESRAGSAGTRLRQHRTAGGRGDVFPAGARVLHAVGDVRELRDVPRGAEPSRGGARMGRTRPRQQGGDAALSAASRAVVVPQGQGVVEASPEGQLT